MDRIATSSPLPTSSFHIPDPVHGCLTGMGSGLCSPAVSQSMAPQAPPALGSSCFRPDKQTMCWRVARGQDHPSPSNTGRQSTEEEPPCPRVNPLPGHCDLELQTPGGGASRVDQTDPSSLEPIRTLERCLGNGREFGGWGQKSWLCLPLCGNHSLRLCKPFLAHGLAYGRALCTLSRSVEIALPRSNPEVSYGLHSPPRLSPFRPGILVQVLSVSSTGPSPLLAQAPPEPTHHISRYLLVC